MGLTSHLSDAYNAFSSSFFSPFALESDDDVSDESYDEGSGSGFTSGSSCSFSFFPENSFGRVSSSKTVGCVSISESVGGASSS